MRLNRLQTNFGNQFLENGAFGCDGKYYFPEIDFLLTEIFSLDHGNEFLPSFSLQFISVSCKTKREGEKKQKTQHESERERTEKNNRRTQQPTSEIKCGIDQANERDRSQRARSSARAPIDPATQSSDRDLRFDLRAIAMRRS